MRTLQRRDRQTRAGIRRIGGGVTLTGCSMPSAIGPGGSFQPAVTADNASGSTTTMTMTWSAGGAPIASETFTVPEGTSTLTGPTVTYDSLHNQFGTDTIAVDAISDAGHVAACGNLTISSTGGPGQPNLGINTCRVSRNSIAAGEVAVFEAEVVNDGDGQGSTTLTWQSGDGTTIRQRSVVVSPGEVQQVQTADVSHSDLLNTFGTGTINVQITGAGTGATNCTSLTILGGDGQPPTNGGGDGDGLSNLGIEHAVLGVGALGFGWVAVQELRNGGGGSGSRSRQRGNGNRNRRQRGR